MKISDPLNWRPMSKRREAYVWWNGGVCHVVEYPSQRPVCKSIHFQRATTKARRRGFYVRVYKGEYADAPKDAIDISGGSFVLPPKHAR